MEISYKEVHYQFKLNGISFSYEDLKEVGYCLIKEGLPFEIPIGNFLIDWVNDSDTISVKTSGSTGIPKLIRLQKQQMVNSAIATGNFFDLKAGATALLCLPTDYISGKMMLLRAMVLGLKLDYVEPNSNPLEHIDKQYDFSAMIPLQLENSLEKINHIQTLIIGGAKMSSDQITKVQNKTTHVFETYGMTETISHIAIKTINHQEKTRPTNFKALPEVKLKIDERSCLVIDAPAISDIEVVTNDVVNLISDSEFEWLGRFDSIINSGGVKLLPEKIEAKLAAIIDSKFFVAGIPDAILGQKLVLIIESRNHIPELTEKINKLSSLEKYEIPKEIFTIEKFITTENGKIQRSKTISLALK